MSPRWIHRLLLIGCCWGSLAAHADSVTTTTGATLTTSVTAAAQGARMSVSITPGAAELDTTEKMYFALLLPSGMALFRSSSGWQQWTGGPIPWLFANAQSECRVDRGFGYTVDFPGIPDLSTLAQMGLGGATFYAGYGASESDMLAQQKYAPIYTVPRRPAP